LTISSPKRFHLKKPSWSAWKTRAGKRPTKTSSAWTTTAISNGAFPDGNTPTANAPMSRSPAGPTWSMPMAGTAN